MIHVRGLSRLLLRHRHVLIRFLPVLSAVGLVALLFGHALGLDWVLRAMDVTHLYVPIKELISLSFLAGELPLWNDRVGCGVPFLANPMTQTLYPGNLLFLLTDSIRGMKLFILVHFVFIVLAFRVMANEFHVRGVAALLGGLVFAASGAMVSIHWSIMWTAGMPWTLLAIAFTRRLLYGEPTRGATLWLATSVLMMTLACAFELLLAYAWFAVADCLAAWLARGRPWSRSLARRLGCLAVAAVIALGAAACQLLPTFELIASGSRVGGVNVDEATTWSLAPLRLLELVAPRLFGSPATDSNWATLLLDMEYHMPYLGGIYIGAAALGLAVLGYVAAPRRERVLLGGMTVITLLMAFGDTTFAFDLFRTLVPGVSYFRYPVKLIICTMIPLCLLVGLGAQSLIQKDGLRARFSPLAGWFTAILLSVCVAGVCIWRDSLTGWLAARLSGSGVNVPAEVLLTSAVKALLHGCVVAAVLALFIHLRPRLSSGVIACLLLILVPAELGYANRELVTTKHVAKFLVPPPALPPQAALADRSGTARVGSVMPGPYMFFYPPYLAAFHGYRTALDYGAMEVHHAVRFRNAFSEQDERRLAMCSVRYRLTVPPDKPDQNHMRVERLENSLPRASLVPRASVALEDEGAAWYITTDEFDPRSEVVLVDAPTELVRTAETAPPAAMGSLGEVVMTLDAPHEVRLRVHAREEAFLLLTDTWYPGWEAYLDGEPVRHYRANVAFRALPVPAGRYEVVFLYRPSSVTWGFRVTGITLLGVLVWVLVAVRRGKTATEEAKEAREAGEVQG